MRRILFLWTLFSMLIHAGRAQPKRTTRDLGRYFQEHQLTGCFVMYDLKKDAWTVYNPDRCQTRFIPASTFKIPNSLIALETGVVADKDFTLKWDGKDRGRSAWNRDHSLQTAFQVSAVWYYQEVARRIGEKRMRAYLTKFGYGNQDIGGGIDQFWLTGQLAISPEEQVTFLKKLYHNKLPLARRTMDTVKDMMLVQDTLGYQLRGKTGWADPADKNIGWFVGYLEQNANVYFFATNVESGPKAPDNFAPARRTITENILREMNLLEGK